MIRKYLPIFKYVFHILFIKIIKKIYLQLDITIENWAIQLVLSSKYSVLQVNCVYKQSVYLHRCLLGKVKVTQVTKNISLIFQSCPASLTK